jgi:heme exporter protein CcmD
MPAWFDNPQASYVLAAYIVAAVVLAGLLIISWYANRKRKIEWRQTQEKRPKDLE